MQQISDRKALAKLVAGMTTLVVLLIYVAKEILSMLAQRHP